MKEQAFDPASAGNRDYFEAPELGEDITRCRGHRLRVDLHGLFQAASSPCIVKFRVARSDRATLKADLAYAYEKGRGGPIIRDSSWVESPPGTKVTLQ